MIPEAQAAALPRQRPAEPPALRGVLHLGAAIAAIFGTVWLLLLANSPTGYVGAAVFGTTLMLLYWTSAGYHLFRWGTIMYGTLKRMDHAMIFILIAGSYTPFAFQVSPVWWIPVLSVVWGVGGAGALMKVVWPDGPRWLSVTLYVALGWVVVAVASEVLTVLPVGQLIMLAVGGALYTTGGVVYALRRPNPWPRIFGYHEVFHALVVAGSAVHFSLVAIYSVPG